MNVESQLRKAYNLWSSFIIKGNIFYVLDIFKTSSTVWSYWKDKGLYRMIVSYYFLHTNSAVVCRIQQQIQLNIKPKLLLTFKSFWEMLLLENIRDKIFIWTFHCYLRMQVLEMWFENNIIRGKQRVGVFEGRTFVNILNFYIIKTKWECINRRIKPLLIF